MPLTPGTRIGIYEVTATLGAGGMGEVYRARDTTLDRDVALKVLPEAFTGDPERLARFEREAKVLASLNHPNIAAIHGVAESPSTRSAGSGSTGSGQAGARALVLELVDGPTLAERIAEGPVPLDEARSIARQIADALESAHAAGVVHRDLKPANVKLRPDGTVKVLDFGLAKALDASPTSPDLSASPTISLTAAATQMGVVLGTAAYMAPEQASGKPVDKRADVWALGVVICEMLTGRRPFAGDDVAKTLAQVIAMDPDLTGLPADLPPGLAVVLRRCLEKEPGQRLHDVADLRLALEGGFESEVAGVNAGSGSERERPRWRAVAATAVTAAVISGLGTWALMRSEPAVPEPPVRFKIDPSAELLLLGGDYELALSRDAAAVVFQGGAFADAHLVVRALDELADVPVRGTEGGGQPVVSPDGEAIAFSADGGLYRVPFEGGVRTTIAEGPFRFPSGLSWSEADQLFFGRTDDGLFRVSAGGGEPERVTSPDPSSTAEHHISPSAIPGRNALVFVIATTTAGGTSGRLATVDLESGVVGELGLEGFHPRYLESGHLVYVGRDGVLRGVRFDASALEVAGSPVSLLTDVSVKQTGSANFDLSAAGDLVYIENRGVGTDRRLVWVDREGRVTPTEVPAAAFRGLSIASDGARVAVEIANEGEGSDVWVTDVERGTLTRVTNEPATDGSPMWHPDGRRVAFASDRNGGAAIFIQPGDGSGQPEELVSLGETAEYAQPYSWTPDGNTLFVQGHFLDTLRDIGTVTLDPPGEWQPLLQTEAEEWSPALSPDGRWLAYTANYSGRNEVYVVRYPELDGRVQVSTGGGHRPHWSPSGDEITFQLASTGGLPETL